MSSTDGVFSRFDRIVPSNTRVIGVNFVDSTTHNVGTFTWSANETLDSLLGRILNAVQAYSANFFARPTNDQNGDAFARLSYAFGFRLLIGTTTLTYKLVSGLPVAVF